MNTKALPLALLQAIYPVTVLITSSGPSYSSHFFEFDRRKCKTSKGDTQTKSRKFKKKRRKNPKSYIIRFEVSVGKNKKDWDLPESLLDYVAENLKKYIKDCYRKSYLHAERGIQRKGNSEINFLVTNLRDFKRTELKRESKKLSSSVQYTN